MSSSSSKTLESESKPSETANPETNTQTETSDSSIDHKTKKDRTHEAADKSKMVSEDGEDGEGKQEEEEEEEEEEEGECGFCLFMKGGGCRDSFTAWEKCIEEAEKNKEDIVEKCFEVTGLLKKCMEAHSDYYEPILKAEKAAEEEAVKELERESAASKGSEQNLVPKDSEQNLVPKDSEQNVGSSDKQDD